MSKSDVIVVDPCDIVVHKDMRKEVLNGIEALKDDKRLRVWTGIFYPESTRPEWQKIWTDNCICCSVSPLHDRDVHDTFYEDMQGNKYEPGDKKKPHRHVVFRFSGPKSYRQVWDILKLIAVDPDHCPPPMVPRGDIDRCVQYHTHYNDKTKAQYLRSDIISINGFDVDRYFRLNSEQESILFDALFEYIEDNDIKDYWELLLYLNTSKYHAVMYEEMFTYCRSHTILVNTMLRSRLYYKAKQSKSKELKERFKDWGESGETTYNFNVSEEE